MDNPFSQPDLAAMDLAIADCLRKFNTHSHVDVDTRAFTQRLGVADCFFDVLRCQDIDALEQKLTVLDGVTAFRATDKLKTLRAATVLQAIADELHLKPFVPSPPTAIEWYTPESAQDDQPRLVVTKTPKSGAHIRSAKAKEEQQNRLAKQSAPAGKTDKPVDKPSKLADEPIELDQLDDKPLPRPEFVGLEILHEEAGRIDPAMFEKASDDLNALNLPQGFGMIAIGGTGDRVGEAIEAITEPAIPQDLVTDPLLIETDVPSPPTSMSTQSGTPATREVFNLQTIATFNQPSGVPSLTLLPKGSAFRINQSAVKTLGLKQAQTVEFTRLDGRLFIRFDQPAGVGFPFQKSKADQAGFSFSSRGLMRKLLDFLPYESTSELPISTTKTEDGYELLLDQVTSKKRQN